MPLAGAADTVAKGRPIEALIVFSGCSPDRQGNCFLEADYKILKPDGSLYAEYQNTEVWLNKPAVPLGRVGLAVDRVGVVADPEDPLGEYRVYCTVRDDVANTEVTVSSGFVVVEADKNLQPSANAAAE